MFKKYIVSFMILICFHNGFGQKQQSLKSATSTFRIQSSDGCYQKLLQCTFEEKQLVLSSIVIKKMLFESKTDASDLAIDLEVDPKLFKKVQTDPYVLLFQKLSHDEQLKLFAHWIVDEEKLLLEEGISITKQFLLLFVDKEDGAFMIDALDGDFSDTEEKNRAIDPAYYDALRVKEKNSSALKQLHYLKKECRISRFTCYSIALITHYLCQKKMF